jgi:hypothetical protein
MGEGSAGRGRLTDLLVRRPVATASVSALVMAMILVGAWSFTDTQMHVGFVFAFVVIQAAFTYVLARQTRRQLEGRK